jgi:hypothetical protein
MVVESVQQSVYWSKNLSKIGPVLLILLRGEDGQKWFIPKYSSIHWFKENIMKQIPFVLLIDSPGRKNCIHSQMIPRCDEDSDYTGLGPELWRC